MAKLAILGIDGATWEIMRPLLDQGQLPHIASLLEKGCGGELRSETPPITPPAWTSMMTGLNPGQHGVFHFLRRPLGSYAPQVADARAFRGREMYSVLQGRGWTTGALNVPMTFPPPAQEPTGSWTLSGIPCPLDPSKLSSDPSLLQDLQKTLGHPYRPDVDYAPWDPDREPVGQEDWEQLEVLRRELFAIERERLEVLRSLLAERPTDLQFTVLAITDRCQHYFWRFQDRQHPGWSAAGEERFGSVIADAYRLADEFLGVLLARPNPGMTAIVSDHGFGSYLGTIRLNAWLEEQGYLVRRATPYGIWQRISLGRVLEKVLGPKAKRMAGPLARLPLWRRVRRKDPSRADVNWGQTQAWSTMHGICLNVKGRDPQGIVPPEEVEALMTRIEADLAQLRLPDGKPALDYTVRATHAYVGPWTAEAPDLQMQFGDLAWLTLDGWETGEICVPRCHAAVSGTHRFEGVFGLMGPGVLPKSKVADMHIRDTLPTLLHALGQKVPAWMEGTAQTACLTESSPVRIEEVPLPKMGVPS